MERAKLDQGQINDSTRGLNGRAARFEIRCNIDVIHARLLPRTGNKFEKAPRLSSPPSIAIDTSSNTALFHAKLEFLLSFNETPKCGWHRFFRNRNYRTLPRIAVNMSLVGLRNEATSVLKI